MNAWKTRTKIKLMTVALLLATIPLGMAAGNEVLRNGGFEEVGEEGCPVAWLCMGNGERGKQWEVEVVSDARSGNRALRMMATAEGRAVVHRAYPYNPQATELELGDLVPHRKGRFIFWYKVIRGDSNNIRVYVLPMKPNNLEATAKRAVFVVPANSPKGEWLRGEVAYDYSNDSGVRAVQPGLRINEGGTPATSEVLFDDITWAE